MLSRRHLIATAALLPLANTAWAGDNPEGLIAAIERRAGCRLGVSALDTGTGHRIHHRADERFRMCSTFKTLAAAAILSRVDRGLEHLDRFVPYGQADLFSYAPVTRAHVDEGGLQLGDLLAAAVSQSDNGAANLILTALGGPAAVTAYARALGDKVTRLDRTELALNTGAPDDPRDTTSPNAMLGDINVLLLGRALSDASRAKLTGWMKACTTAATRIPAGLPRGWTSGDKTGTSGDGTTNDVAIIWPPQRKPILLAAYSMGSTTPQAAQDAVIADVARVVCATI
ncbi:MAG TPA: class A beta-lactamase [Rhizomicrobium sp.]|jgi:beta-lactamase class A